MQIHRPVNLFPFIPGKRILPITNKNSWSLEILLKGTLRKTVIWEFTITQSDLAVDETIFLDLVT